MSNFGTVQGIAKRISDRNFGRVNVKEQDDYLLLTYTAEAQYSGNFTEVEKACRGLVIRKDGRIMALPMPKFFNLGEPQCPPLPDEKYEVWEKVDGSLVIFWHDGEWRCNTKGSFDNQYIDRAMQLWQQRNYGAVFEKRRTIMFEVVLEDDDMQRAAFKPPGLYLIAVRDNYSGKDVSLFEYDLESLESAKPVGYSIDALLEKKKHQEGVEGWVVRFEGGLRVKIKTNWYLKMFRAIQVLSPKNIRELMLEAGEDWINEFPDDLRPEALEIQRELEEQLQDKLREIHSAYSKVAGIESRKEYALTVLSEYPSISSWLFKLRDNRFNPRDVLEKMEL